MTGKEVRDPRDPRVQTEDYIKEHQIKELFEVRPGGLAAYGTAQHLAISFSLCHLSPCRFFRSRAQKFSHVC